MNETIKNWFWRITKATKKEFSKIIEKEKQELIDNFRPIINLCESKLKLKKITACASILIMLWVLYWFKKVDEEDQIQLSSKTQYTDSSYQTSLKRKNIINANIFIKLNQDFDINDFNLKSFKEKNWIAESRLIFFKWSTLNPLLDRIVTKYYNRAKLVNDYYQKMWWNGADMVKELTGVDIKWQVNTELVWASIVFYICDKSDYKKLETKYEFKKKTWWFNSRKLLNWAACFISWSNDNQRTKNHELQHSYDNIIMTEKGTLYRLKTEIISYLKGWDDKKYIKRTLTDENWLYNYFEELKKTNPKEYKEKWDSHKELADKYINQACEIKNKYPQNYNFILSFTHIEERKYFI